MGLVDMFVVNCLSVKYTHNTSRGKGLNYQYVVNESKVDSKSVGIQASDFPAIILGQPFERS